MPGTFKTEHVRLQVPDLDAATTFYRDVLGLAPVAHEGGWAYFGCGYDANFDLAVREGRPGIEHAAVRVADPAELDTYATRLADEGVETRRTDDEEPGQEYGLRFALPSGYPMELLTVRDKSYKHYYETALPGRGGLAPLDVNHVNFHSPDVERDATFLRDVLDFKVSAVIGDWEQGAFLRRGDRHHDVALFAYANDSPDHASHHHTGVSVSSVDHMVTLLDWLTDHGVDVEFGIGRHYGGDNVFAYVVAPDGHRIELVTQMTELDDDTPVEYVDDVERAVSAWHGGTLDIPASWTAGSGLAGRDA